MTYFLQRCTDILQLGLPAQPDPRPGRWGENERAFTGVLVPLTWKNVPAAIPRLRPSLRAASHSSAPGDIFRAVSQILPYIEAHITAQPAVVQDAGAELCNVCQRI